MPLIVQKFGGTSVGETDRIRKVAEHIALTQRMGNRLVVVVSAMGKTTDELIRKASEVSADVPGREMDMLLTSGERISMSLLAMALNEIGVAAQSFTGSQAGIITNNVFGKAKVLEMRIDRIQEAIDNGIVPVVAGFQGVSRERNVTTLGRGGSDTTAVALAAALNADACEIYTDVSGVFSADPRIVPDAHRIAHISFDEMQEIAATGGRVLALRSVEFARKFDVDLHVRSSFTWEPGTWVSKESPEMEEAMVTAVTHDLSEAKFTVKDVPDHPGVAARIFRELAAHDINVDMIVQNVSTSGSTDISFTAPKSDIGTTMEILQPVSLHIGAHGVTCDESIARVSVVGAGMKSAPGVAATMFETLAKENVNIDMISTSTIRTSVVIASESVERVVRALHDAYHLESNS